MKMPLNFKRLGIKKAVTWALITSGTGLGLIILIGVSLPRSVWDKQAGTSAAPAPAPPAAPPSVTIVDGRVVPVPVPAPVPPGTPATVPTPASNPGSPSPASGLTPAPPPPPSPTPTPSPAPVPCGSAGGACSTAEIAAHNSAGDCWMIYSGEYFIVTSYVAKHPGGAAVFNSETCGHDITAYMDGAKATAGTQHTHIPAAYKVLNSYKVGPVQ